MFGRITTLVSVILIAGFSWFSPAYGQPGVRAEGNGGSTISVKVGNTFTVTGIYSYNGIDSLAEVRSYFLWDSTMVEWQEGTFSFGDSVPAAIYSQWSAPDSNAPILDRKGKMTAYWLGYPPSGEYFECDGCEDTIFWSVDFKAINCGSTDMEWQGGIGTSMTEHNGTRHSSTSSPALQITDLGVTITGNCLEKASRKDLWGSVKAIYR